MEALKRRDNKYIKMSIHRKQNGIFPESLLVEIQNKKTRSKGLAYPSAIWHHKDLCKFFYFIFISERSLDNNENNSWSFLSQQAISRKT